MALHAAFFIPEDRTLHSHRSVNLKPSKHHIVESEIEENTLAEMYLC
jgi:hypothetical protein